MSRVARYAKVTAKPGSGDDLADDPGCELYLLGKGPSAGPGANAAP